MSPLMGKRSRTAPNRDTLQDMRDVIAMHTSGYKQGGLRCDFSRLDEGDQRRVVELVREAGQGGTWAFSKLSKKDRTSLERLIEQASGEPGIFARVRGLEEVAALAAEAHQASVRRPLSRKEETGIFHEIAAGVEGRSLDAADVAVIAAVVTAFVSGRPLGPRTRIERVGEISSLVIENVNMGLFGGDFDPEQQIAPRWRQNLAWLEQIDWFQVEKHGTQWTISPGARLRAAMGLRSAA